jgi:HD-GYP domain-containing protein (c-di-GMP phosphodiesterase class II)
MRLYCQKGTGKDKTWTLKIPKTTIGRDAICDIALDDPKISRIHGEIVKEKDTYVYSDKNSTNGSFINGYRVRRQILLPGDVITLGNSELIALDTEQKGVVEWRDGSDSQITSTIPLDIFSKKFQEMSTKYSLEQIEQPVAEVDVKMQAPDLIDTQKMIRNLQNLYDVTEAINTVMALDDLFNLIMKQIFKAFGDVERICILLRDEKQEFSPRLVAHRDREGTQPFVVSRSIFQHAIEHRVSLLANDATSDERFARADSVINLNLRSVMCAPLVSKDKVLGAIYLDNREKPFCFDQEDVELLTAFANQAAIAIENSKLYEEIQKSYHDAILALINAIEAKDPYTCGHTQRTSRYTLGIAQELGLTQDRYERLKTAAELHDIGKIGVRERIMDKTSDLSDSEFESIQAHVVTGEKILKPIEYLQFATPIIRGHHERFDGTGYPDGLSGEEILLESRILAVADAFDAMTTQRPYNTPLSLKDAIARCKQHAGTQFDPHVVDALDRFIMANHDFIEKELERINSELKQKVPLRR